MRIRVVIGIFLQWDTVSYDVLALCLRDFAYYSDAEKLENKIAEQKFDNDYGIPKIKNRRLLQFRIALEFKRIGRFTFYSR
jgi:hypothetical protein